MPSVIAAGVDVNFPFEPYPCQIAYMEKVITCLKEGYNGILESPTGTGKTLCLLCSSLAWLESKKAQISNQRFKSVQSGNEFDSALPVDIENDCRQTLANQLEQAAGAWSGELGSPKIIFASRTHSQLSQAIQELRRTSYSHFKVCVIGSREQLCIHPQIAKEPNNTTKVHMCRAKVSSRTCHFYNQVENGKGNFVNHVLDIEDLVVMGQKLKVCPYYTARELKKDADIIFMPYNYLLDPKSRKAHSVELQGNIVIFDEAHNLEKICEDSASFDLCSSEIASAIEELNRICTKLQEFNKAEEFASFDTDSSSAFHDFTIEDVLQIKVQLLTLEKEIDNITLQNGKDRTEHGSFIFDLFEKANITFETQKAMCNTVEKIVEFLSNDTSSGHVFSSRGHGLSKILDVVRIVFSREPTDYSPLPNHQKAISKDYRVHVKENDAGKKKQADGWGKLASASAKSGRTLSYWCFSPGHTMEELKSHGVKSIILTSGTLSPLSSFISEMGIDFKIQLENPHVIAKEQVWIGTIAKGPDGTTLSSAYDTRFRPDYQSSMGNSIVNFSRLVPNGLLLFFPSYPLLEQCIDNWQKAGILQRIERHKPVFVEPKNKLEFATAMENFYERVNDSSGNGAIFAAVCRGKVSEGLDFADANGRAVVITGLPFPPRMDPKVILKMKFLDDCRSQGGKGVSGADWYRLQASRAVNQAIGRVIRHRQDYGAIILCDSRFCGAGYQSELPLWLRSSVKNYANFGLALKEMTGFFKTAEKMFPVTRVAKKRKKPGEMGCEGAFFMPTVTRTLAVSGLTKAAVVETHIPSLRPNNENSFEKMMEQYCTYDKNVENAPRTVGLLGALDHHELQKDSVPTKKPLQAPVTEGRSSSESEMQAKKKKIVIKTTCSSVDAAVTQDNVQTAEQYLSEVRLALSAASYNRFSTALKDYKLNSDGVALLQCATDLFGDDPCKYHLFRKFCRFVRREHRDKFKEVYQRLVGGSGSSRQLLRVQDGNTAASGPCAVVRPKTGLSTNLVSGSTSATAAAMVAPAAGCCNMDAVQHLSTKNYLSVGNHLSGLSCGSNNTPSVQTSLKLTTPVPMPVEPATCPPDGDTNLKLYLNSTPSGYVCCRCAKDAQLPFRSPCNHICCLSCWNTQLQESKTCPECSFAVKRNNLQQILFQSGPKLTDSHR